MTTRAVKSVLIVNPRSGGGKADRFDLVAQCRARGIEPILFEPGDDLTTLATAAVRIGANALGMAGGDGSQAAVAAVAAEHDLPYVCIPAGTRNHFALDLGIDRNDVVSALDAFSDGHERSIDLGRVNGRAFVNNVAMGVYGAVVQSSAYREHKMRTVIDMMRSTLGQPTAREGTSTEVCSGSSRSRARRPAACRSGRRRRFASTRRPPPRSGSTGRA
jgi:diacylglycerol kinase family enzyme